MTPEERAREIAYGNTIYAIDPADRALLAEDIAAAIRAAVAAATRETQHKASQYDSVVQALKVADGGRWRNDTIDSLLVRLGRLDEVAGVMERATPYVSLTPAEWQRWQAALKAIREG